MYLSHPLPEIRRLRERQQAAAIRLQEEPDLGTAQGQSLDDRRDSVGFGPSGTEEAPAYGQVHEQISHLDRSTYRMGGGRGFGQTASEHPDMRSVLRTRLAGRERQGGDGGNSMQRLTPEAQRDNPRQVFGGAYLARRVASHRPFGVVGRHPRTVVVDPNEGDPAAFYLHLHARRPRIERIFDELLHRRSRALYYLAGGYTMGYFRR